MIISREQLQKARDTLVCLAIILTSGWPIIRDNVPNEVLWPATIALFGMLLFGSGARLTKRGVIIWLFFLVLVLIQTVVYWEVDIKASFGFLFMLTCAVLAFSVMSTFRQTYTTVMSAIAVICVVFFVLQQMGVLSASQFSWVPFSNLEEGGVHSWFYNFHPLHVGRNSGPFWEPGVFAGYLIVALSFQVLDGRVGGNWKSVALVVALLTTTSTTGYLALVPIALMWLSSPGRRPNLSLRIAGLATGISVILVIAIVGYMTIPILGDKVDEQYERTMRQEGAYESSRVGAIFYDGRFILERPLVGWTPSEKPRRLIDPSFDERHERSGNGFSGFAANFGVVALLFYLYQVYLSGRSVGATRVGAVMLLLTVTVLLQGEQFLNFPLLWGLAMLRPEQQESEPDSVIVERVSGSRQAA